MKPLIFSFFLLFSSLLFAQNVELYVGTYTVNTGGEGIYRYYFNTKTGELHHKLLVTKVKNPSFITLSKNKKKLFTVSENGENGVVQSYSLNKGKSALISETKSNGAAPCHISLNKNNSTLVVSNYGGGTIALYKVSKTGKIATAFQVFNHNIKQDKAHAHSAKFFKNNLFTADLGRDFLAQYVVKPDDSYQLKDTILMKDKAGPRHFEISKKGKFIYVINELNSTISVLKNNNNNYTNIQNINTLNTTYTGKNSCADIHLSKNQQFLYGSNRGENSIVVFKRNKKNGKLTKIQSIGVEGNWPRNFTLSPNGKFLLVANQYSNNICVFKVHKKTGKLNFVEDYKQASPVCLIF
ncbi:lactonase family protein [Lutibacter sp. TH_r2]|uniref:lactonase family protein n=1 Tax=Lutibacter sp. TH_r2 TaxID=3082083 RepID=UPI002952CFB9|nr:lactonase family protein [Lutibacter sp. TH_r2]MDV7186587.1 lactonase family protein [Lutibacter sp. TH_r2]